MYFLPADGREKVIKIRCFSNETAIVEFSSFTPAIGGGVKEGISGCGPNWLVISFPLPLAGVKERISGCGPN
ncbi:MAG: hypothetical protein LBR79_07460 [Oscillospiraceae bacterium]|nr:hypothetical protein [Oscillospiraceae bacterium]